MPSISIPSSFAISSPQIGRPLLGLELVERRADRVRLESLGAAEHVLDTGAPHHAVFPRAHPTARHILPHVPRPPAPTARVGLGHLGQLVVREHRSPHPKQCAQSTPTLLRRGGYVLID